MLNWMPTHTVGSSLLPTLSVMLTLLCAPSAADEDKRVTPPLRGVLVELATSGVNRFVSFTSAPLSYIYNPSYLDTFLRSVAHQALCGLGCE
jgi:hypothetical protein